MDIDISSESESEHGPASLWARLDALDELESKFITSVQQHIRQHQQEVAAIRKHIREDQQKRLKNEKARRVRLEKFIMTQTEARAPHPPSSAPAPPSSVPAIRDDEHLQHTVAELDRLMDESGDPPPPEPELMPTSDHQPEPEPSAPRQGARAPFAPMALPDLVPSEKPAERPVQKAKCSVRRGKKARIPVTRREPSSASTPEPATARTAKIRPTRGVDSGIAKRNGSRTSSSLVRDASVDSPAGRLSTGGRSSSAFNSIPDDPYLFSIPVIRQFLGGGKISGSVWHVSHNVDDPFQYAMIVDPTTTPDVPEAPMKQAGILDLDGFEWMGDLRIDEKLVFPLFLKRAKGVYQYLGDFIFTEYLHLDHRDFAKMTEDVRNYWISRIAQPNKDKLVQMMLSDKGQSRSLTALDVDRKFRQHQKETGFRLSKVVVTPSEWNRETYRGLVGLAKDREEDKRLSDIDPSTQKKESDRLREEEVPRETPKRAKKGREEQNLDEGGIMFPSTSSWASGGGSSARSRRLTGGENHYNIQKLSRQLTDEDDGSDEGDEFPAPPAKRKKGMVIDTSSDETDEDLG